MEAQIENIVEGLNNELISIPQTYTAQNFQGDLKISMKTKEAGAAGTMQTRPYQLRVESSANTLYNQTVNVEIVNGKFVVRVNSEFPDLSYIPFANGQVFVLLFAGKTIILQGIGFQARMDVGGDIFIRVGSKYFRRVS